VILAPRMCIYSFSLY